MYPCTIGQNILWCLCTCTIGQRVNYIVRKMHLWGGLHEKTQPGFRLKSNTFILDISALTLSTPFCEYRPCTIRQGINILWQKYISIPIFDVTTHCSNNSQGLYSQNMLSLLDLVSVSAQIVFANKNFETKSQLRLKLKLETVFGLRFAGVL